MSGQGQQRSIPQGKMDRLRQMLKNRTPRVSPGEEDSSRRPGLKEEGHPIVIPYRPGKEVEEEQEGEDLMLLEEEALIDIIQHLQGQGKDKEHGERFLLAIPTLCRATKQRGKDNLEPETCKMVLLQKIMPYRTVSESCIWRAAEVGSGCERLAPGGLMETATQDEEPNWTLCNSIAAICSLSELKPALEPAMESCLLQTTLKICLTSPRHNSLYVRTKQQKHMEDLEALLRSLLATAPSLDRLQFLWEVSTVWRSWALGRDCLGAL
ncbi:hypothetical protein Y1Q_0000921 [Alligator mississippiensis]|uniref:Uncharacterized protein n=1 Tax=Alligator mississippiensis TaxID=8496 RepID=A0A151NDZ1_ALLMI|nr:hypothetical protein Y1Q_0000921 [Alligator mississippiensis]